MSYKDDEEEVMVGDISEDDDDSDAYPNLDDPIDGDEDFGGDEDDDIAEGFSSIEGYEY